LRDAMTTTTLTGPWLRAPNLSADSAGSIHDEREARPASLDPPDGSASQPAGGLHSAAFLPFRRRGLAGRSALSG